MYAIEEKEYTKRRHQDLSLKFKKKQKNNNHRANVELNGNCQLAAKTTATAVESAMPLVSKSAKAQFLSSRPSKNMLQRRWCSSSAFGNAR